jgi:hypothetical protein
MAPLDSRYPLVHASVVVLGGTLAVFAGGSNFQRSVCSERVWMQR